MPDRILLVGLSFYGYHGVRPEERSVGQRFLVDLELELDLRRAGGSDDLADTVDYAAVGQVVREVVEGPPRCLLEAVAEAVAARLLDEFRTIDAVLVRVKKPLAALAGRRLEYAAVEVRRERSEEPPTLEPYLP